MTPWCNARLGSFDSPWPYFIYFGIMFASPLPCRPRDRTAVAASSIFAGCCLLHPENLSHPLLPEAVLFLLGVAGCAALLGVWVWAVDTYRSVIVIGGTHPYLYENPAIADHVSGTAFVDMVRQLLKAITHLSYGAAIDGRFVLHGIELSCAGAGPGRAWRSRRRWR